MQRWLQPSTHVERKPMRPQILQWVSAVRPATEDVTMTGNKRYGWDHSPRKDAVVADASIAWIWRVVFHLVVQW